MTRTQVFAELRRRGATRAEVHFYGGNDEGFIDHVRLFNGKEEIAQLATPDDGTRGEEIGLVDALCQPVFDEYGSFAGDFDVDGVVIWDVEGGTALMDKQERADYQHSSYEV